MQSKLYRQQIFDYAKRKYNSEPEYLWLKFPEYAVLRCADNSKWYAVIMDIPKNKIGLSGDDIVDIIDVKCDSILIGSLIDKDGYFPAYHMSKSSWITILLDGTVPIEEILDLMDLSYGITQKKR